MGDLRYDPRIVEMVPQVEPSPAGADVFWKEETSMRQSTKESDPRTTNNQLLLAYMADLELEVDRLRKQGLFIQHEAWGTLKRIRLFCADAAAVGKTLPPLAEIDDDAKQREGGLRDL